MHLETHALDIDLHLGHHIITGLPRINYV